MTGNPTKLLIIWNGTLAGKGTTVLGPIGGGDQVIIKCVNLSGLRPDLILPKSAQSLITSHQNIFLTKGNFAAGLPGLLLLWSTRTMQGIFWAIRLRKKNYDVVLATSPFFFDLLPLLFCKARRKGTIVYHVIPPRKAVNWGTRIRFGLAALETKVSLRLIKFICDFIITGNYHAKEQFEALAPGKPVFVLHAGFNTKSIDVAPEQEKDNNRACFLGRLTSQKGIFDLLAIMDEINKKEPGFRLVIMGSGPERELLAATIKQRKIDSITLKGFVGDQEKYTILKQSRFFFFPSYEEGWGIALAEALYCGATAICYELPHYKNVFGSFPVYAALGNMRQFVDQFFASRRQDAVPEQKEFMRQYDDEAVARSLVQHLETLSKT